MLLHRYHKNVEVEQSSLSCLQKVHNDAVHENTDTCVILWGRVVGMIMKTTKNLTLLLVEMQQYPEYPDD